MSIKNFIYNVGCVIVGLAVGIGIGIYSLPIIIAYQLENKQNNPENVIIEELTKSSIKDIKNIDFVGNFHKKAKDSDFLHYGRGDVIIIDNNIVFHNNVSLSPGPDYRLYAVKKYTETKKGFLSQIKTSVEIARVSRFSGKQVFAIPEKVNMKDYEALVVWCKAFSQFISVAKIKEKKY